MKHVTVIRALDSKEQPRVLLATTLWWPLSARLAVRLVECGGDVSAICPRGHLLDHVAGIRRLYRYRARDSRGALESAIEASNPDFIVPCDDRVVWQLHELHAHRPHLRAVIERSLGPASQYEIVARRERLLETAHALGIRIPETRSVTSEDDARIWFARGPSPSVLKLDGTWGGSGIHMVDSEEAALLALAKVTKRGGLGASIKRRLVNRDPLAAWTVRKQERASITIQKFIDGRPANAMMACWRGEVLATVAVEVLSSQGPTGAGIVVRVVQNQDMARAAGALAQRLCLTGFYGLDFVVETATGLPYLIEMNPRCTQLGHLAVLKQGKTDLAGIFYARLADQAETAPAQPIDSDVVAFFPQALLANPESRFASGAYLDIPWRYPELIRELMLPSWPQRRWLSRLYHYFRPSRHSPTVDFELGSPHSAEQRQQADSCSA